MIKITQVMNRLTRNQKLSLIEMLANGVIYDLSASEAAKLMKLGLVQVTENVAASAEHFATKGLAALKRSDYKAALELFRDAMNCAEDAMSQRWSLTKFGVTLARKIKRSCGGRCPHAHNALR